ncbi:MAG TPA: phosphate-starvation-inducible PsiE family protein [Gammaproteobacteria bacterium]|nr:phosphate-starvation-inducible PsiE family protein [Gammaproteobacteria bacterium]
MSQIEDASKIVDRVEDATERIGNYLVDLFQFVALFVIGATVVWSAVHAYWGMVERGSANVEDILLLFIYLELGAMVGIYFKTSRLPVQFLIYVAITVMTRSLASSLNITEMPETRLIAITGATLILAISVLVLRYASHRFPPFVSHTESDQVADKLHD